MVQAYGVFLETLHAEYHAAYRARTLSDPDAAIAEAVVFSWLRAQQLHPVPSDVPGTGGPDFLCLPDSEDRFAVEVTHLDRRAVEARSGWPDEVQDIGTWTTDTAPKLAGVASQKTRQLGGSGIPGVLAVCLTHSGASELLGTLAAEGMMTSSPMIAVPLGEQRAAPHEVTDLRHAAFIRINDGVVEPVRRTISTALLIAIWNDEIDVVGLIHPDPVAPIDYRLLPEIPFLRLEWPVRNGVLRSEWVISNPTPRRFFYSPAFPSNDELRGK